MLPGDDFKELWQRVARGGDDDITALATVHNDQNEVSRKGYFLGVGPYFAFTMSRPMGAETSLLAGVVELFSPAEGTESPPARPSTELMAYLQEHVTVLGLREDWKITHALDPQLVGHSLALSECRHEGLRELLLSVRWEVLDGGVLPRQLECS